MWMIRFYYCIVFTGWSSVNYNNVEQPKSQKSKHSGASNFSPRVCQSCHGLCSSYSGSMPVGNFLEPNSLYFWNLMFLPAQIIWRQCQHVGSLNLCLKKPDSLQKESAQSDHPAKRKRSKCAEILGYFAGGPKLQNSTTFWTFSQGRVIGLSWFLLHWVRRLETQV